LTSASNACFSASVASAGGAGGFEVLVASGGLSGTNGGSVTAGSGIADTGGTVSETEGTGAGSVVATLVEAGTVVFSVKTVEVVTAGSVEVGGGAVVVVLEVVVVGHVVSGVGGMMTGGAGGSVVVLVVVVGSGSVVVVVLEVVVSGSVVVVVVSSTVVVVSTTVEVVVVSTTVVVVVGCCGLLLNSISYDCPYQRFGSPQHTPARTRYDPAWSGTFKYESSPNQSSLSATTCPVESYNHNIESMPNSCA